MYRPVVASEFVCQDIHFLEEVLSVVKVASTPKEIAALLETGFEYIMTKDNLAYFRKRK